VLRTEYNNDNNNNHIQCLYSEEPVLVFSDTSHL
jgi:hypothetical protein